MNRILLLSILSLLLSGCVQNQLASAYNACETYPKWIDKAQCQDSVANQDPLIHQNTTFQEIVSYRRLLIEKVKNKKMSNAEAEYAFPAISRCAICRQSIQIKWMLRLLE